MTTRLHRSRARDLLVKLAKSGSFTEADLCSELVVSARQLILFSEGLEAIPLDRQLCLAAFLIERVPALAGSGYALRSQVKAAMAFECRETSTHASAPPLKFR
jgi:hypothetical protein